MRLTKIALTLTALLILTACGTVLTPSHGLTTAPIKPAPVSNVQIAPVIACGQHAPSPTVPAPPMPTSAVPADDHGAMLWYQDMFGKLLAWAGTEVDARQKTNILRENTAACLDKLEATGQIRQTN